MRRATRRSARAWPGSPISARALRSRTPFHPRLNLPMAYKDVTPPAGAKITKTGPNLTVPDNPIIPFIRGDGTGPDIWAGAVRVLEASVEKAYAGKRKISWFEVYAGEESFKRFNN